MKCNCGLVALVGGGSNLQQHFSNLGLRMSSAGNLCLRWGRGFAAWPWGSGPSFLLRQSWEDVQGQLCDLESCFSGSLALSLMQEHRINLQFHTLELQGPYRVQCFSGASSLLGF